MARDPYEVLGVPSTATVEQIKAAYRKLAHQHHPDKGGDANKFKEINEAYQQVKDGKRQQTNPFGQDFYGAAGSTGYGSGSIWEEVIRRQREQQQRQEDLRQRYRDIFNDNPFGYGGSWDDYTEFRMSPEQVRVKWLQKLKAEQQRHDKEVKKINEWFQENLRKAQ